MKGKTWLAIIVGILVVSLIVGKVYMDKKAEEKQADLIEAERMSVEALKNTFADIKSVEFEKSAYNEMTGSYTMFVKMTNQNNELVNFMYVYVKGRDTIESSVIKNETVQIDGVTTDKVQIVYSNKSEDEI